MNTNDDDFPAAIARQEVPAFFKGEGRYFKRDPEWGVHLHIRNWETVIPFLKEQAAPQRTLTHYFEVFLNSLSEKHSDADALLMNLRNYYYLRGKHDFLSANGYDLVASLSAAEQKRVGQLIRYLRAAGGYPPPMSSLDEFLNEIYKNGCNVDLEKL